MASDWADEQGRTQLKFDQCRLLVNLKIVADLPPSLICLFANKLTQVATNHFRQRISPNFRELRL